MSSRDKAAIYARVSTANRGQDPEVQLRQLRTEVVRRGLELAGEYVDEGFSGAKASRPGLDALMAAAAAGAFGTVLVWRFDRFARSTRQLIEALEAFRSWGVEFVSLQEAIDTSTPAGEMVFTMIGAMAQLERRIIQERVAAGVARAKAEGKHCGRPRQQVDLSEAPALLASGLSERKVARKLNVSRSTLRRRLSGAARGDPSPTPDS